MLYNKGNCRYSQCICEFGEILGKRKSHVEKQNANILAYLTRRTFEKHYVFPNSFIDSPISHFKRINEASNFYTKKAKCKKELNISSILVHNAIQGTKKNLQLILF